MTDMIKAWGDCPICGGKGKKCQITNNNPYPAKCGEWDSCVTCGFVGDCPTCLAHWRGVDEAVAERDKCILVAVNLIYRLDTDPECVMEKDLNDWNELAYTIIHPMPTPTKEASHE